MGRTVGGVNCMVVVGFAVDGVNGVPSVDGGGVDGVDGVYWVKVKVRFGGFLRWRWSYEVMGLIVKGVASLTVMVGVLINIESSFLNTHIIRLKNRKPLI
ncbi:hypothetical protein Pyn_26439 [Prunus yedoensis var. nudiflora]|uniref:Transmembrane protein n=1 Tax=Prunus yedoensis var. nudiflora TaxID=2094558 RepID=A0A314ZUK1_PRUYE|nr:hypothetical protein Pyn_26439 [Prunus yedoensis var. nudiflora]